MVGALLRTSDTAHARAKAHDVMRRLDLFDKRARTAKSLTLPDRKRSDLFEESFELPEIDAETRIDLSQVQSELARVRPQIALAVRQARRTATKELSKQKQELKKQGQEIQKNCSINSVNCRTNCELN